MKTIFQVEKENPTLSVGEIIDLFQKEYTPLPRKPTKPYLLTTTPTEIEEYTKALAEYQVLKQEYDELLNLYVEQENYIEGQIWEYIKEKSGLNALDMRPDWKENIANEAYRNGHSEGYVSIYNKLCNFVDLFPS